MSRAEAIREFLLKEIALQSEGITAKACKAFSVSSMTINRHLQTLIQQHKIIKVGKTQDARYFLIDAKNKTLTLKITKNLDEFAVWTEYFAKPAKLASQAVYEICEYGFTEVLNNAKDHSNGRQVKIEMRWDNGMIIISITDDGTGIFRKLKNALQLEDMRDGILALSKGKLTTDPENHTGEGIFFSSRAFDEFDILANGIAYLKDNLHNEWTIQSSESRKGTQVIMRILHNRKRQLKDIFDAFTTLDTHDIPVFNKTEIRVELARLGSERYISRSQAKRILHGLDQFQKIILDFHDIEAVGQGFVDEVFRVYQKKHPKTRISYHSANDNVEFMIKRGTAAL